jgi:hypothetical protein
MTMSPELMKAILAMDAYNRGYDEGVTGIGNAIGSATFFDESDVGQGQAGRAASFYAVAYTYAGEKVISFRGTDDVAADALTGWGVGVGSANGVQALLALEFYKQVSGGDLFGDNTVSFTGHSMGGGGAAS